MERMISIKIFGKSPVNAFLRLNKWMWKKLPAYITNLKLIYYYGLFLNKLVRMRSARRQFFGTFFFRNRPELEFIRRLIDKKEKGSTLSISILGCSNGAEVYSILWTIRSARPDLTVMMYAVDISREILELARKGVYSLESPELVDEPIFERMTEEEMREMFDREKDQVIIKPWIKKGITWHCGDAGDPGILNILGPQDMVVANRFLCHMLPQEAGRCLRNIARLVKPGGYIFVSGIDLDVRTSMAYELNWKPNMNLIKEIHDGDITLRVDWPFEYWGLEPFNNKNPDWKVRYASVFQVDNNSDLDNNAPIKKETLHKLCNQERINE